MYIVHFFRIRARSLFHKCGNGTKSRGCGALQTELNVVFVVDLKRARKRERERFFLRYRDDGE